jgi:hypothetical protein
VDLDRELVQRVVLLAARSFLWLFYADKARTAW